jgi:class 3 adenylate cyclase
MQRSLLDCAWPGGARVRVRMGVHSGEAELTAAGLVGLDVHRAARVAAVGHGGQVLVSEAAATLVRNRLPSGAALRDLGAHRLKDLGYPERIFQLCAAGLLSEFPLLKSLATRRCSTICPSSRQRSSAGVWNWLRSEPSCDPPG